MRPMKVALPHSRHTRWPSITDTYVERRPCYRARPTGSVPSVGQCSTNPVWQKRVIRHVVVRTNKRTAATQTRQSSRDRSH